MSNANTSKKRRAAAAETQQVEAAAVADVDAVAAADAEAMEPFYRIENEGEIYFQAATVSVDMIKKIFKDMSHFLTDLHFTFSPAREISVFNSNDVTHDMVSCRITQFDYFQCSRDQPFYFSVKAKDMEQALAKFPLTAVVSFYISETCLNAEGGVDKLGLHAVCTETTTTYERKLSTFEPDGRGMSPFEPTYNVERVTTAMFLNQYRCEIRWMLRNLHETVENLAIMRDARVLSLCASPNQSCDIESDTNSSSTKIRMSAASKLYSFQRFDCEHPLMNRFRLQSLQSFLKCRDLCSEVGLFLDSELPLILKFDIPNFGTLCALTPIFHKSDE